MDRDTAHTALLVLAISGGLGFLLPSLDKTWETAPSNPGMARQLTKSGVVFGLVSVGAGILGSKASGSCWPLVIAVSFTLLTFHVYGEALHA